MDKFKFAALLIVFAAAIHMAAQSTHSDEGTWDEEIPYIQIVVSDNEENLPIFPDSVFYKIAGSVIYPVNIYTLPKKAPLLTDIDSIVVPMARINGWRFVAMQIRGAASPEGPERWNRTLGERRAKSLIDYIARQLDQDHEATIVSDNGVEDYIGLVLYLKEHNDADMQRVADIVERNKGNNAATKRALQQLDGGKVWRRLLRDVFPQLRAARVILYFQPFYLHGPLADTLPGLPEVTESLPELRPKALEMSDTELIEIAPIECIRQHALALRSNLLYDAFYMPNFGWAPMPDIQVEYYPRHGNFTLSLGFTAPYWHKWDKHKFFQIRNYNLEGRYYLRNIAHLNEGPFLGAYINTNRYGIGLNAKKGWQGEGVGAGLSAGYVLPLANNHRWRLELTAAFGMYVTKYDPYVWGNPTVGEDEGRYDGKYYYNYIGDASLFVKRSHRFKWFGPTQLGISLTYDLLFHRIQKKGTSFKRKEVVR